MTKTYLGINFNHLQFTVSPRLSYFPPKLTNISKFCFNQKTSERLLYKMEKIENSFENKVSRVELTDTPTDRQTDTEFY